MQPKSENLTSLKAVLWDMDGTLIDTEEYWFAEEAAIVNKYGGTWSTTDAQFLIGKDLMSVGQHLQGLGVPLSPLQIVEQLLAGVRSRMSQQLPWRPGAEQLLHAVRAANIPCALVTMSWSTAVQVFLDALPGVFQVVITGDRVQRSKPHPEPYLLAAHELGLAPNNCVAIEDSPTGLASAEAAGTRALVVPHILPIPAAPGRSRASSLQQVDLTTLQRIGSGQVLDLIQS